MDQNLRIGMLLALSGVLIWTMRQAAGRLAPKMAFAPLIFLLTRWPVLLCWALGSTGMFALLELSAAANGKDPSPLLSAGISLFCGVGVAALVVGPIWAIVRALAPKTRLELEDGEVVHYRTKANHMLGNEARGGELLITDRRLAFKPHRFNVQLDNWSAPLWAVHGVRAEGARLLLLDTDRGEEILVTPDPAKLAEELRSSLRRAV
jgi:hypothetical protein